MNKDPKLPEGDAGEILARLLLAAKEDEGFRQQVLAILRLPLNQRQSIVNNALHEMEIKGEAANVRQAFGVLATDEGAAIALKILHDR